MDLERVDGSLELLQKRIDILVCVIGLRIDHDCEGGCKDWVSAVVHHFVFVLS